MKGPDKIGTCIVQFWIHGWRSLQSPPNGLEMSRPASQG